MFCEDPDGIQIHYLTVRYGPMHGGMGSANHSSLAKLK